MKVIMTDTVHGFLKLIMARLPFILAPGNDLYDPLVAENSSWVDLSGNHRLRTVRDMVNNGKWLRSAITMVMSILLLVVDDTWLLRCWWWSEDRSVRNCLHRGKDAWYQGVPCMLLLCHITHYYIIKYTSKLGTYLWEKPLIYHIH